MASIVISEHPDVAISLPLLGKHYQEEQNLIVHSYAWSFWKNQEK